ncbi:FecR family protein [Larkinella knui]|uniref:FecR family protein n=1 Tax=Larkinella knui TaxID=2025310 RepID=A0A3P1CQ85_9BACT|nr:FecR family protein [Larkinella knui]RRB15418.1 FecR family protein [Larkinella knui]
MQYHSYKAEDFLTDDSFIAWVYNRDAAAAAFWSDWMAQAHPNRAEALLAKDILEALNVPETEVSEATLTHETGQILRRVSQSSERRKLPVLGRIWYAAALLILFLGAGWLVWRIPQKPPFLASLLPDARPKEGVVEQANRTDKPVQVTLPDGSTVRLQPNSRIQHVAGFGQKVRAVLLTGEAFFDVVPNPKVPFLVYARDVVTRVVGTSFTIRAYDELPQVTVAVRTGRVTVYSRKELEQQRNVEKPEVTGVVLTPNQQVVFNAKEEVFHKELVEKPVFVAKNAASVSFEFEDVPLAEVFRRIEETYEIDIVYNESLLQKCTLTASLTGLSLYEQLRLISKSLQGSYEVTDGKVLILATGCGE